MDIHQWEEEFQTILSEFKEQTALNHRHIFVVGCSTSEVAGKHIGTAGTEDVAQMVFRQLKDFQKSTGVQLAFQCCEHLNRALVIERQTAEEQRLEEVSAIPVRNAGGAMAAYAYEHLNDPVLVESVKADAGIDIGDTFIGMHLKAVAIPVRTSRKSVGHAHVTLAKTRPKLIGGPRAVYEKNQEVNACH